MLLYDHLTQAVIYKLLSLTDILEHHSYSDSHQLQFLLDSHSILHQDYPAFTQLYATDFQQDFSQHVDTTREFFITLQESG